MAIAYGESNRTELTRRAPSAMRPPHAPGSRTSGHADFAERLAVQLAEMDADEERTGIGRMVMFADCTRYAANRLLIRDLLRRHPEILDDPDRAAGDRRRSPPLGHHPPGEPAGGRQPVPIDAPVGVLRARAEPEGAFRGRREGSAMDPLQQGLAGDASRRATRGGYAPDGARPRARGDRAPATRLLQLYPRVGSPGAAVA